MIENKNIKNKLVLWFFLLAASIQCPTLYELESQAAEYEKEMNEALQRLEASGILVTSHQQRLYDMYVDAKCKFLDCYTEHTKNNIARGAAQLKKSQETLAACTLGQNKTIRRCCLSAALISAAFVYSVRGFEDPNKLATALMFFSGGVSFGLAIRDLGNA